jgi:Na+/melibiose symporter-like transporter
MGAIGQALRQPALRLLLTASLISSAGDWVLRIGLAYYIYALTGSTLASALMLLASFIPAIALGSLAGVFVDRWPSIPTMVVSNLLLAVGLLPLAAVRHPGQAWIVYAVMAWEGCVQQFFTPAEQSLLPRLVASDQLITANALAAQSGDVSRLIGAAAGGVVAATVGISALAGIDAASFVISAALIAWIRVPARPTVPAPGPGSAPGSGGGAGLGQDAGSGGAARSGAGAGSLRWRMAGLRAEWADGLRLLAHQRALRVIMIFVLVTCFGEGIMSTLFAPFVRSVLHGSGGAYGAISSAQAIGGIAGGLLAAAFGHRARAAELLGWGAVAFGAIDLVMFLYPLAWVAVWPAAVCMVIVGLPGALSLAGAMTLLQRDTADSHRGRVFGALGAVEAVALVAGTFAAGYLGQAIGIIPVIAVQGGGFLAAGLLVLVTLRQEPPGRPAPAASSPAVPAAQT